MFGIVYALLTITGHVVNTTQEYLYNTQNWIDAKNKGNITYVDRRGGVYLTATGESVVSHQTISLDMVRQLHLPVYCLYDSILTDTFSRKVLYNFSEVKREENFRKKLHFKKPNETVIFWTSLKPKSAFAGIPQGLIYKDVNNGKLYLKRKINRRDLMFYMDFESGYLVRVADESCNAYNNDDPTIIKFINGFNQRQEEKAKWIEKNKLYLDKWDFGKFVNYYYLNGYEVDLYDYAYDVQCGTVDEWASKMMSY